MIELIHNGDGGFVESGGLAEIGSPLPFTIGEAPVMYPAPAVMPATEVLAVPRDALPFDAPTLPVAGSTGITTIGMPLGPSAATIEAMRVKGWTWTGADWQYTGFAMKEPLPFNADAAALLVGDAAPVAVENEPVRPVLLRDEMVRPFAPIYKQPNYIGANASVNSAAMGGSLPFSTPDVPVVKAAPVEQGGDMRVLYVRPGELAGPRPVLPSTYLQGRPLPFTYLEGDAPVAVLNDSMPVPVNVAGARPVVQTTPAPKTSAVSNTDENGNVVSLFAKGKAFLSTPLGLALAGVAAWWAWKKFA